MRRECQACKFWERLPEGSMPPNAGRCHLLPGNTIMSMTDWCAQFEIQSAAIGVEKTLGTKPLRIDAAKGR